MDDMLQFLKNNMNIQEFLINKIYKKLEYACFLELGKSSNEITDLLKCRNWEIIQYDNSPSDLSTTFDNKFPTIFHYSWVTMEYTNSIIDYIDHATNKPGWQKRFILIGFEDITLDLDIKLKSLYYSKIESVSGNFYIHDLYKHYLNRK